ncbi:hypothetical protein MCOR27_009820 [Pyricularia oryzae]|uniref:Luciferase domain-containing protein n=2 Tax=Pyricularia TaxID=48558 RepID=A0ABQ8N6B1_PYRGI|nr:hypothetical protein MCOR01_000531 [Pyricularia oryzae]KAI6291989.1 hypothetical protein MCOR33_010191 [Pyricularia grisea]KAH9428720.1 hypothetical protein MCOR02_011266 [Pyricularia oryzae]KAI6253263.1 hypothetical protein MCOR19_010176 [Pyricularia oryzae]KAI6265210.1 hypothetical protein MCOR26_010871 [Pyricularia oryzae]
MPSAEERVMSLVASIQSPGNRGLVTGTIGAGLLAALLGWCYRDYQSFLALGPGGLPYNLKGWAIVTLFIRPFAMSKSKVTSVADYPENGAPEVVKQLPVRRGERAILGGIAPHRQMSQHAPERMRVYMQNLFDNAVKQHPELLEMKKSLYERHHDALFVSAGLLQSQESSVADTARVARGEIGHMHTDLSIHLYLSPADARQVIQKNWGERHRLSVPKTSWFRNKFGVADTYLMIYGPRDEKEMEVFKVILARSISFMTGKDVSEDIEWRKAL